MLKRERPLPGSDTLLIAQSAGEAGLCFVASPGRALLCVTSPELPVIQEVDSEMYLHLRIVLIIREIVQWLAVEPGVLDA